MQGTLKNLRRAARAKGLSTDLVVNQSWGACQSKYKGFSFAFRRKAKNKENQDFLFFGPLDPVPNISMWIPSGFMRPGYCPYPVPCGSFCALCLPGACPMTCSSGFYR